ncbi:MAG: radical SAM protein [Clostridia bacterium]|nr:radical SAM protein [Clostridia bacterium]
MTISYVVKNGIYINLTNRCSNSCKFCIRQNGAGVYGSDSLWLEREPTAEEVIEDLEKYDFNKYDELVFCGYGEPTECIDTLVAVAKWAKSVSDISIRINTNGHGNMINGKDITPMLEGTVDIISVSLNCADAESYAELCIPEFGIKAYDGLIEFARLCVPKVKKVVLSVVETTLPDEDIKKCAELAQSIGAELRVRPFE